LANSIKTRGWCNMDIFSTSAFFAASMTAYILHSVNNANVAYRVYTHSSTTRFVGYRMWRREKTRRHDWCADTFLLVILYVIRMTVACSGCRQWRQNQRSCSLFVVVLFEAVDVFDADFVEFLRLIGFQYAILVLVIIITLILFIMNKVSLTSADCADWVS